MIGGNTDALLQVCSGETNAYGVHTVKEYVTVQSLQGFLDMSSGDSRYTTYNAKVTESTHIFICDYVELDARIDRNDLSGTRMLIDGQVYDVKYIDDPMGLHQQLEVYLSYKGGSDGADQVRV